MSQVHLDHPLIFPQSEIIRKLYSSIFNSKYIQTISIINGLRYNTKKKKNKKKYVQISFTIWQAIQNKNKN